MALHFPFLEESLAQVSDRTRRTARDYLTADRLVRRICHGTTLYAAQLHGYQDTYTVYVRAAEGQLPEVHCDCDRPRWPCAHSTALLIDLLAHVGWYQEMGWEAARHALRALTHWPFESGVDWTTIPETAPWWRLPCEIERLDQLSQRLAAPAAKSLERDAVLPLWAEMHPTYLDQPPLQALFEQWLEHQAVHVDKNMDLWALLHWMQPRLPLAPVFAGLSGNIEAADVLVRQLYHPHHPVAATRERRDALLADLTWIDADLAHRLWLLEKDASVLAMADALFAAGHPNRAGRLLADDLPLDPAERREARLRLIDWLELEASLPHRLALAWESRSLEPLQAVRYLLPAEQWAALVTALGSDSPTP